MARNFPITIGKGNSRRITWNMPTIHGYYAKSIYHWNELQITQSRSYKILYLFCNRGDNIRTLVGLPLQGWGDETSIYPRQNDVHGLKTSGNRTHPPHEMNIILRIPWFSSFLLKYPPMRAIHFRGQYTSKGNCNILEPC